MRIQPIHRRYAPYVMRELDRIIRNCVADAASRCADADSPYKVIPDCSLDMSAEGQSFVIVDASWDYVVEHAALGGAVMLDRDRRKQK